MRITGDWITRHRNLLIVLLLLATMVVSSLANQERLAQEAATVSLPVAEPFEEPAGKIETFRRQRDAASLQDIAALQALIGQEQLDQQIRAEAAAQLQAIIDAREKQLALEGTLMESGFFPCVAVVSAGQVTIVTEKSGLSDDDAALLLAMAQLHAGVQPAQVSVIATD